MSFKFLGHTKLFLDYLEIYELYDLLELLLFTIIIYSFLKWLNKDKGKKPVFLFYSYVILLFGSHYLELTIFSKTMFWGSPGFLMFLILIHQKSLQKNFIQYQKINLSKERDGIWPNELIRSLLTSINKQREIVCVIEQKDNLDSLLKSSYYLNADLKKNNLELLVDSKKSGEGMFWIGNTGKIKAVGAHLKIMEDSVFVDKAVKNLPIIKQDAIFLTSKTDAIVIIVSPANRAFDFLIQGKIVENLSPQQAVVLLEKQIFSRLKTKEDDELHANQDRNTSEQQLF